MRAIVTGGCGFVGSNLIEYLIAKGYEVINLSHSYIKNPMLLEHLSNNINYRLIPANLNDTMILHDIISGESPDVIFHLAGETFLDRSYLFPIDFLDTNVIGTFNLLEAIRRMDKSPKFVYLSTDMVLGNIAEDHKSIETDMVHPDNPYAASKACGEMYVISYAKSFGIQGIVVRCTNNYGPRQYPQKVCGRIIMSNLIGKPYTLGYGNVVKGWSYVEDTCSAIEYIANNGTIGEIYHIPASSYITIEELNSEIMKNFDKKIFIGFQEQRLKDDNQRSYLDGSKLLAMGWNHITPLDVGIKTTIEWFRRNEWFWK